MAGDRGHAIGCSTGIAARTASATASDSQSPIIHGPRNSFITVAKRELMLPPSLTKRLVNHARPNDMTQRYAGDWTITQLREPAQRTADRIEALMCPAPSSVDASA